MKPVVNPVLVRNVLTILGAALTTLAAADQLSWQSVVAAVGGALIGWMRRAPNHVDVGELPMKWQQTLLEIAKLEAEERTEVDP